MDMATVIIVSVLVLAAAWLFFVSTGDD